jgi:hypothetical protein
MHRLALLVLIGVFMVLASSCQDNPQATPDSQALKNDLEAIGVRVDSLSVDTIHVVVAFPYSSQEPNATQDIVAIVKAMCKDFRLYYLDATFSDGALAYVDGEMVLRYCQGRYTKNDVAGSLVFTDEVNK